MRGLCVHMEAEFTQESHSRRGQSERMGGCPSSMAGAPQTEQRGSARRRAADGSSRKASAYGGQKTGKAAMTGAERKPPGKEEKGPRTRALRGEVVTASSSRQRRRGGNFSAKLCLQFASSPGSRSPLWAEVLWGVLCPSPPSPSCFVAWQATCMGFAGGSGRGAVRGHSRACLSAGSGKLAVATTGPQLLAAGRPRFQDLLTLLAPGHLEGDDPHGDRLQGGRVRRLPSAPLGFREWSIEVSGSHPL